MSRVLIVLLLIAVGVWIVGRLRRSRRTRPQAPTEYRRTVRCRHCGVHLPAERALTGSDGQPYCCEEHRRSAAAARPTDRSE